MSVIHGGAQDSELAQHGLRAEDVLDLSANLHPDGPHPAVIEAARSARLDRYPPSDAQPLREAVAEAHGLDPATILPTPGGTAAIHLVARAILRPGDTALIVTPTFGEYVAAVRAAGANPLEMRTQPPTFELRLESLSRAVATFVGIPDNPTGRDLTRAEVVRMAEVTGGTVVLDAAYEPFLDRDAFASDLARVSANVVAVHSMTKLHAVPGLRLGYVVASPPLIARLALLQHSWSIDAPSLEAGRVATGMHEARRSALRSMRETREWLRARWQAEGFTVAPGTANFLLVRTGDARQVREAMLSLRIVVRDATSFGLPDWLRIAIPPADRQEEVAAGLSAAAASVSSGR